MTYLLNSRPGAALHALARCPLALPIQMGRKCCMVPWPGAATAPSAPPLTPAAIGRVRYRVTWKDHRGRQRMRIFPRRGLRGSPVDQALGFQRRLPYGSSSAVDLQTSGKSQ